MCITPWAGGSDVFLPVAHLQLEVAEAALLEGVGAAVIWRDFQLNRSKQKQIETNQNNRDFLKTFRLLLHGRLSYSPSLPPVFSSLSPFFSGREGVFCNAFE
jgi:hypothetical protein